MLPPAVRIGSTHQGNCLTNSYTFNGGTNRVDGAGYDGAGNYTSGGYGYDAENRLVTAPGGYSYVYDAEGHRVAKKLSGSITSEYLLDSAGAQLIELDGSGNVLHTNLFANGKLFATYKNDNPASTNSNAYVTNALQYLNVPTPQDHPTAPGSGTNLNVLPLTPPSPPPPPPCSVVGACAPTGSQ